MAYWLMKSEPSTFSIDDLIKKPQQIEPWNGVRNYQVRNMLRDQMRVGDLAFFYHSSCPSPGIVGIIKIVRAGYPDPTALDQDSDYYDPKSDFDHPRWYQVDVQFQRKLTQTITLDTLRQVQELAELKLLQKGNRLSILPLTEREWACILEQEG